jgi:tetratricopeptide (TPR) repeat protein
VPRGLFLAASLVSGLAAAAASTPVVSPPALEPIPFPQSSALEPAVAEQIRGLEGDLNRILASPARDASAHADAFGEIGELFHAYELWDAAAAAYRNAMRLAPRDYRWIHLLADVEARRGNLEEARRLHANALALRPGDLPSLVGLGEALFGLNRLAEAAAPLREAVRIDPGSAAAHAALGRVAFAEHEAARARDEFEKALALVPDANRLHYELAMALRDLGDRAGAARHLARAGTVGIKVADDLVDGVSERRRGERAHLVRGRLAYVNGRMREAADEFGAAVAAEPRSVPSLVGLGSALGTLGDTDRALEAFRRALALSPDNVAAHYNVGRILSARGDTEAALREFEAVLRLAPDDEEAVLAAADLGGRQGRFDEARRTLEAGLERMPSSGRLALALSYVLAACPDETLRDGSRALDLARRTFETSPSPASGRVVALALAELGRCGEAAAFLARLLDGLPAGTPGLEDLRREADRARRGPPCRPPGKAPGFSSSH